MYLYVRIYIYIYLFIYPFIDSHIYIYGERRRERERESMFTGLGFRTKALAPCMMGVLGAEGVCGWGGGV